MNSQDGVPDTAIFVNGMFEGALREIEAAQKDNPQQRGYLQPYDRVPIKHFEKTTPTVQHPITLYISLTTSLDKVSYIAKAVGWKDKRKLTPIELASFKEELKKCQPSENDIYLQGPNGHDCVNLIIVSGMRHLDKPIKVSDLKKTRDHKSLKARQTSGKWAYVFEFPVSN